ncbi:MAG: hypothetical protein IEMM0002_1098 [bacterium]|nr:MAG: hypothetical protein IEMM0002_1098 [bacterium]
MEAIISFFSVRPVFVAALLLFFPFAFLWNYLCRRKAVHLSPETARKQLGIGFTLTDYIKAFISWIFLFMPTYHVRPGLYYIGKKDADAPLLVTANNFLTVFLLARRIGKRNVRLLVIDTGGINVWCSAGKGRFSTGEIINKARPFGLTKTEGKTVIILPKFSLAGVRIEELRKNNFRPVIGPLYAKDIPAYLDKGKLDNRVDDVVHFGLKSRAFTALPTAIQFFYYFLAAYVVSLGYLPPSIIWMATALAFTYPLLFPFLPGKFFAVKGISLAAAVSPIAALLSYENPASLLWQLVFIFATSIFIGLSYTGNSAVSNYTSVRKETARFLPVVIILYILLIPIKIYMGGA